MVNAAVCMMVLAATVAPTLESARWGDGNRLRLFGNAGILLVLEWK